MKPECLEAQKLLPAVIQAAGYLGMTVRCSAPTYGDGCRGTLHIMFNKGNQRILDYWPGTGKWKHHQTSGFVKTLLEALDVAKGIVQPSSKPCVPPVEFTSTDRIQTIRLGDTLAVIKTRLITPASVTRVQVEGLLASTSIETGVLEIPHLGAVDFDGCLNRSEELGNVAFALNNWGISVSDWPEYCL